LIPKRHPLASRSEDPRVYCLGAGVRGKWGARAKGCVAPSISRCPFKSVTGLGKCPPAGEGASFPSFGGKPQGGLAGAHGGEGWADHPWVPIWPRQTTRAMMDPPDHENLPRRKSWAHAGYWRGIRGTAGIAVNDASGSGPRRDSGAPAVRLLHVLM
jgi:hypothetical protein